MPNNDAEILAGLPVDDDAGNKIELSERKLQQRCQKDISKLKTECLTLATKQDTANDKITQLSMEHEKQAAKQDTANDKITQLFMEHEKQAAKQDNIETFITEKIKQLLSEKLSAGKDARRPSGRPRAASSGSGLADTPVSQKKIPPLNIQADLARELSIAMDSVDARLIATAFLAENRDKQCDDLGNQVDRARHLIEYLHNNLCVLGKIKQERQEMAAPDIKLYMLSLKRILHRTEAIAARSRLPADEWLQRLISQVRVTINFSNLVGGESSSSRTRVALPPTPRGSVYKSKKPKPPDVEDHEDHEDHRDRSPVPSRSRSRSGSRHNSRVATS